ncbi:MAG: sulfatase [bacterium]
MPSKNRPDIVLVSMDATRADHLSSYGHVRPTTPNLDGLAENSVLYERSISPACWTLPSHASMFTGLYPSQHGTHFGNQVLSARFQTLAEKLRNEGYQTAGFCCNAWLDPVFGFNRGFETYRLRSPLADRMARLGRAGRLGAKVIEKTYSSRNGRASKSTLAWVRAWLSGVRRKDRPFFLFVLLSDPHLPHFVHREARRFLGAQAKAAERLHRDPHRFIVQGKGMTEAEQDLVQRRYDSQIACMDQRIGELLALLGRETSLDDALVMITSDHGENLGDHGLMAHQYCLYDTLLHVPLIIHFPDSRRLRNVRVDSLVQTHELFTTVLDVVGASRSDLPNDLRGRSLVPEEVSRNPLPFAVSEEPCPNLRRIRRLYPSYDCSRYDRRLRSLRTDTRKYIWASDGRHELYDLQKDPGENRNLIDRDEELAGSMQARLNAWLSGIQQPHGGEIEPECDEIILERLKQFGYL